MKQTKEEAIYILIDTFGEPIVTTNKEGETIKFSSKEKAERYGKKNLQQYQILKIDEYCYNVTNKDKTSGG